MGTPTPELADRLATPEETGLDPALLVPLMRLLAHGNPVSVEDLATTTGRTVDEVRDGLAAAPDTEYDDRERIVGQGLTLRPTPHRFTVAGQELYTWCALDTLVFPALIEATASIESTSPASGRPIHLTASPDQVTDIEPPTAVVSLVNPEDMTSIRSSFCNQVHFFASAEDAQTWLAGHPGAEILPVADAYQLGTELTAVMLDRLASAGPVGTTRPTGSQCRC